MAARNDLHEKQLLPYTYWRGIFQRISLGMGGGGKKLEKKQKRAAKGCWNSWNCLLNGKQMAAAT
jgi:hypothetical protein